MAANNSITIVGRLGSDPEIKTTPKGTRVAKISVGQEYWNGTERVTQWHRVTLWDKKAEVAEKHTAKGTMVAVVGELRYNVWTDDKGVKHKDAEVNANDIELLSKPTPKTNAAPSGDPADFPTSDNVGNYDPFA